MNGLEIGLDLVGRGLMVFPCKPKEYGDKYKAPFTPHGYKDATGDPKQLYKWWETWPGYLAGMPGGPNNICTSDYDDIEAYNQYRKKHPEWFNTWIESTPRGGRHVHHMLPAGVIVTCKTDMIAEIPHLDIKSTGGYAIVYDTAGIENLTTIPDDYLKFLDERGFVKHPKAPAPVQAAPRVVLPESDIIGGDYWVDKYATQARAGDKKHGRSRNVMANMLATQLHACGYGEREARHYMLQYQRRVDRADMPYTEKEALDTLAFNYANYDAKAPIKNRIGKRKDALAIMRGAFQ